MTPPVQPCEGGCGAMPGDRCECVVGQDRETGRALRDGRLLCACGCGGRIDRSATRRRSLEGHRQRAYERRLEAAAAASGRPARLRLKDVDRGKGTSKRQDDALAASRGRQTRKPRPGVTVYLPSPADLVMLDRWLDALMVTDEDADLELERVREATVKALKRAGDRVPSYIEASDRVRSAA